LDLIKDINDCIVTISISSLNHQITNIFEKNAPDPTLRLKIINKLSLNNIKCGVGVIPFLPFIMDNELENIVEKVSLSGSNFILLKPLELRGDLKTCVFEKIKNFFPKYFDSYMSLYKDSFLVKKNYSDEVFKSFKNYCLKYKIDSKIKK
jgi:DNA repair photolyase